MSLDGKNPSRVAAGLKASLHNDNVSAEAKQRAADRLAELENKGLIDTSAEEPTTHSAQAMIDTEISTRELGGYKATLSNPNTSDAAKMHASEILKAVGVPEQRDQDTPEEEHQRRVLAGYKAALHNPNVSPEAKKHAMEYLQINNAL